MSSGTRHQLPCHYFLASSRFVPKKNLDGLLKAYSRYRQLAAATDNGQQDNKTTGPTVVSGPVVPWSLVILGDGPLRSSIIHLRSSLGLDDHVHLTGFKQYAELPVYYALASAFIMPSLSETWSLAVNEAMACGLPVVVSSRCGCAGELVQEGVNGFIFDPYNINQLASLMLKISTFDFPLSAFGNASLAIISNWGTDRFSSSMKSAADTALRVGPCPGTLVGRWLLNLLVGR